MSEDRRDFKGTVLEIIDILDEANFQRGLKEGKLSVTDPRYIRSDSKRYVEAQERPHVDFITSNKSNGMYFTEKFAGAKSRLLDVLQAYREKDTVNDGVVVRAVNAANFELRKIGEDEGYIDQGALEEQQKQLNSIVGKAVQRNPLN